MRDPGTGMHDLHVTGLGTAFVAKIVAMGDRAFPDIGHDLHVAVRMRIEARAGRDLIVVPHAQAAEAHALRIVIAAKTEVMMGVQPVIAEGTESIEGAKLYHFESSLLRWR